MNKKFIQKYISIITFALITLFLPLVFSKTTFAVTYNVQLKNQQYVGTLNGGACYFEQGGQYFSVPIDTRGFCGIPQNSSISQPLGLKYALSPTYNVDSNNYYQIGVTIIGEQGYDAISWAPTAPYNFTLIDFILDYNTTTKDYCDEFQYGYTNTTLTRALCNEQTYARRVVHYTMLIKPNNDGTSSLGFGNMNDLRRSTFFMSSPVGITGFYFDDIYSFELAGNDLDKAEQETQQATDEGQQNSDSAATDNEGASQNLLQVAGGIVSAFSSPATNCSLNGDLGNVNLGTLNFCTDKPTAIISAMDAIATCIVAFMVFRIIKRLIGRFTALSAYGQGGSE